MNPLRTVGPLGLLLALISPHVVCGDDWPQWRGPERTGVSKETGLLQTWPKDGPKQAWKVQGLGIGYASPAIANGKVFLMGTKDKDEYLFVFDEKTGDKAWSQKIGLIGENRGPNYPGPRSTP